MIREKKKILAISGSTRKFSSNEMIIRFIAEKYKNLLEVEFYDAIDKLPHFNPDLDTESPPEEVNKFRNMINLADGVLICTPEYVFSLPGSMKNAIDWNVSTTVFTDKPVAIIVASASGDKAFESLCLIMNTVQARIADDAKFIIKGAKGKVDKNGLITDEEVLGSIHTLVQAFIKSIDEVQAADILKTGSV